MRIRFILLTIFSFISLQAEQTLIPREVLFGNPARTNPQLSPDATQLSFVAPYAGVLNIWIRSIDIDDPQVITHDRNRGISNYMWTYDNENLIYIQDVNGSENWQIFKINLQTKESIPLTPDNKCAQILKYHKKHPNEMLILLSSRNGFEVHHLNITTGISKRLVENSGDIQDFYADADLNVRGIIRTSPAGGKELLIRNNNNDSWRSFITWNLDDSFCSFPCFFHQNGTLLYLIDSRGRDKTCLKAINLTNNQETILVTDEHYDVGIPWLNMNPYIHPETEELIAMPIIKERREHVILNDDYRADFDALKKIDEGNIAILNWSNDFSQWLIQTNSDTHPARYYLYNHDLKTTKFLFSSQPQLERYKLQKIEPFSLTARDGLTLHGYISYPDVKELRNLPVLLDVHGGPWERNCWGFSPDAQFFTNRGYVYIQINFRGSTSYGKEFLNAGNKEWGRKMHNDLLDTVDWAINQGIAHPKKIAIAGFSYGGYAALCGAAFSPKIFKCAISLSGISNLRTLISNWPKYATTFHAIFRKRVGDFQTESALLKERSPLFSVDKIEIPLLIGQGANDIRITPVESQQIVTQLNNRSIPHEYLVFENEGHGLTKPENRIKWVTHFEKFLAKHLGGRCQA